MDFDTLTKVQNSLDDEETTQDTQEEGLEESDSTEGEEEQGQDSEENGEETPETTEETSEEGEEEAGEETAESTETEENSAALTKTDVEDIVKNALAEQAKTHKAEMNALKKELNTAKRKTVRKAAAVTGAEKTDGEAEENSVNLEDVF